MGSFLRSALLAIFLNGSAFGSTALDVCLFPMLMPTAKVAITRGEDAERIEIQYKSNQATATSVNVFFTDWFKKSAAAYVSVNDERLSKYVLGLENIFIEVNDNASRYGLRTNKNNKVTVILRRAKSKIVVTVGDQSTEPFDPRNPDDYRNRDLRHCANSSEDIGTALVRIPENREKDGNYVGDAIERGRGICMIEEQLDPDREMRIVDKLDWYKTVSDGYTGTGVYFDVDFANWARLIPAPN